MANLNLNKAILAGRLTADVELKQTPSGVSVCRFNLAVNRRYQKDKEQTADFISCVAWRQTAEFISKYFKKGSSLCVTGTIQTGSFTDNQGNKRFTTEILVDEAMFVDGKNDAQQAENTGGGTYIPDAYKEPQTPNFEAVGAEDDLPF